MYSEKCFDDVAKMCFLQLTILEVKSMEVMSFHQVAQCLWLKGSQSRITNFPVAQII